MYVDLTKRKVDDTEVVLVELLRSDFHLLDASITIVRGSVQGRSPVTAVKLTGEPPWDPKARGDAPAPLRVELRNALIRGPQRTTYLDSRQAHVRLENTLVCSPGPLLHLFHTRPLEFDHQRLLVELGNCTLDTDGPLVTIDCRPFQLTPTPLQLKVNSTFLASSFKAKPRPPQILWQSPVEDKVISATLHWRGRNNCYFQRGEGMQAKSPPGPLYTFVETPADWLRLGLGEETSFLELTKGVNLSRYQWDRRLPSEYPLRPGRPGESAIGADPKRTPNPRRVPGL